MVSTGLFPRPLSIKYIEFRDTILHSLKKVNILDGYSFSFTLKVDPDSTNVGGMNLFGKHFGDYAQDIVMKVEYEND